MASAWASAIPITSGVAGLQLDLDQQTQKLAATVIADLQYFKYSGNAYSSEVTGRFDGNARFSIVPERFDWILEDNFGVAQVDRFAADTPGNREIVNYLTTGPQLSLLLGRQGFLKLSGLYSILDFEISNLDANRIKGELAWGRNLSAASQLSLNLTNEAFRFSDSVSNANYTRRSGYVNYHMKGARTDLGFNLGASRSNQGANGIGGPLLQLDVTRQVSSAVKVTFSAGSMLTDSSDTFRSETLTSVGQTRTSPAAVSASTFERRYGSLSWKYQRNRIGMNGYASYARDAYESRSKLNVSRMELFGAFSRRVTRTTTFALFASATRSEYLNVDFVDWYSNYGASLDIRAGSQLHFVAAFNRFLRSVADITNAPTTSFHENRGTLTVTYRSR
jgi:hypothetical protein